MPLALVVIVPEPRTDVKHDSKYAGSVAELEARDLCVHRVVVPPASAAYVRGQQQFVAAERADDCLVIQRPTLVLVLTALPAADERVQRLVARVDAAVVAWRDASSLRRALPRCRPRD